MIAPDPMNKPRIALPDDLEGPVPRAFASGASQRFAKPSTRAPWSDLAPLPGFLNRKIWGVSMSLLLVYAFIAMLAVAVQLFKLSSSSQHEEIKALERKIAQEKRELRALKAEAASLEQPERLEILARTQLGMEPEQAEHEIDESQLLDVAAGTFKPIKSAVPRVVTPIPAPAEVER